MLMAQIVHVTSIQVPKVSDTWKECVKSNVFVREIKSYQSFDFVVLRKRAMPSLCCFYLTRKPTAVWGRNNANFLKRISGIVSYAISRFGDDITIYQTLYEKCTL